MMRFKVLLLAVAATAIVFGLALAHAAPARVATGPYASALTRPGAVSMAALPKCNGRVCEFIAPGYHCLFDGGGKTLCQTGTSGCTNVACR